MNNALVKTLVVLAIVSIGFSVALCSYSALGSIGMSHHEHVVNLGDHLIMAHSFNVFIVPLSLILNLLFLVALFLHYQLFIDLLSSREFVYELVDEKIKQRFRFGHFNPRSPPKY